MISNDWNPDRYAAHAAFVPALARPLVDVLAPRPRERILDLGCGDGVLTAVIAASGVHVVGVDASAAMVAAARARGIDARVSSAEDLSVDGCFDAVFSNAMLHWVRDVDRALAAVRRALRPGGRFVGEFGGEGNVRAITDAAADVLARRGIAFTFPWYFPSADDFRLRLEAHGFVVEHATLIERPTPLPTGMRGWLETFGAPLVDAVSDGADRAAVLDEIETQLAPRSRSADGTWTADYVRLRFVATLPV